jgi:hypothetical protein
MPNQFWGDNQPNNSSAHLCPPDYTCDQDCLIIMYASYPQRQFFLYFNLKLICTPNMGWSAYFASPVVCLCPHHYLSIYLVCWSKWLDPTCGALELGLWLRPLVY